MTEGQKIIKETGEKKRLYEEEHEKFLKWRNTVLLIDKDEIMNLLLFKLNDNLQSIADSLDRLVDHFELGG